MSKNNRLSLLKKSAVGLAAAGLIVGGVAFAQEEIHPPIVGPNDEFIVYAAFAKFESNISEALVNVLLFALAPDEQRATIAVDFEDDLESVRVYADQLAGMGLTGEAAEVLEEFNEFWEAFVAEARALFQAGADPEVEKLLELYEMANEADDAVDELLEVLRGAMVTPGG